MSDAITSSASKQMYRIPDGSLWANAWKMTAVVAVIGIAVAAAGYTLQPERFGFSYLFGYIAVLTIWFGSVFFVLIQHLTGAGWSVSVRRSAEFFVSGVVVLPFLFLPLLTQMDKVYPWWNANKDGVAEAQEHGPHGARYGHGAHGAHGANEAHDAHEAQEESAYGHAHSADGLDHHTPYKLLEEETMAKKAGYMNPTFFYIRMLVYFGVWLWLGLRLFGYSTAQDESRDKQYTVKLQRLSPGATYAYAMSLTFAVFDLVMSLEPGWYSTMFGVRMFASGAVTSFAIVIVTTMGWKRAGLVSDEINTEHFHDLGKLMFGFLIFWAYVSFGEFLLIWYAAIPEETIYFHRRWDDPSWRMLSVVIVTLKFIVPFYVTLSRNAKRNDGIIAFSAFWILAFHLIEMFYDVMPYYQPWKPIPFGGIWLEAGCAMATFGVYLTYVLRKMRYHSLIAVGDPRLPRALNFINE